ncbi:MAG: hypothetical protein ABSA31_09100 [Acidimicrobiales bacterium]
MGIVLFGVLANRFIQIARGFRLLARGVPCGGDAGYSRLDIDVALQLE